MSGFLILVSVGVLGCAVIVGVGVARRVAGGHALRDPHGLGHQLAGLLAGGTLAGVAWVAGGDHRELVLALGPLAGSCWLVGLIVAERGRERLPLGTLPVAGLGPRTAGGIVSRHALTGAVLALAAAGSWTAALLTGGRSVVLRVSA